MTNNKTYNKIRNRKIKNYLKGRGGVRPPVPTFLVVWFYKVLHANARQGFAEKNFEICLLPAEEALNENTSNIV